MKILLAYIVAGSLSPTTECTINQVSKILTCPTYNIAEYLSEPRVDSFAYLKSKARYDLGCSVQKDYLICDKVRVIDALGKDLPFHLEGVTFSWSN